ncbi:MAG: DNA-protecting protein DprA [Bacteroidetes bacterium]|nr:DNA-protecting protein DprA [Bacteroidota bacterium]
MFHSDCLYSIALRNCSFVGDTLFHRLVSHLGTAQKVWESSHTSLMKIDGIGKKVVSEIGKMNHLNLAENELKFCLKNNINISIRHLRQFPGLLGECEDAPAIIYHKGKFEIPGKPIAMVGTREATDYGKKFIEDFLAATRPSPMTTVSGLALGADTVVHEQSLRNQIPTIAVLAHGFQTMYPSKNRKLAERIIESGGALITEFMSFQKPERENFIQRNRIVAGLCEATIVVETAFGGGSMSTATFANNYNRDVYALPGRISDPYSQGCNHLIMQNKASVISTIKDLMQQLGIHRQPQTGNLFQELPKIEFMNKQQEIIYHHIQKNPDISLDDLSDVLSVPAFNLLGDLLQMELLNIIKTTSARTYHLVN